MKNKHIYNMNVLLRRLESLGLYFNSLGRRSSAFVKSVAAMTVAVIAMLVLSGGSNGNALAADFLTMSVDTDSLSLDLAPSSSDGQFVKSGNANISVSTSNSHGYTLSISASDSRDLVGTGTASGSSFTPLESSVTETNFSTSSAYDNKWGYKPSKYMSSGNIVDNTGNNAVFLPAPSTSGDTIAVTECANGTANTACEASTDTYTLSFGARANLSTNVGSYSNTFVIAAVSNFVGLTITYDGNGLYFDNDPTKTTNPVMYDAIDVAPTDVKYSHTPNVDDEGVATSYYAADLDITDTVTIEGATSLHVSLSLDMVYSQTTDEPDYVLVNGEEYSTYSEESSLTPCDDEWCHYELDIPGDTVTFQFHSESDSPGSYGYYAVVTANPIYSKTLVAGAYETPAASLDYPYTFVGWSEDANATTPTYTTEQEISSSLAYLNNDLDTTLYAVWNKGRNVTFDKNDADATGTMAMQALSPNAYSPLSMNGFAKSGGYVLKSWNTEANGSGTDYGDGGLMNVPADNSTTAITLYAQWMLDPCNPSGTTIGTGTATDIGCMQDITSTNKASILSSMTQGIQYQLYDNRDYKQYYLAKQADGNIWMTQNLDYAIGYSAMNSNNTHLKASGEGAYVDGYTKDSNNVITWIPVGTAITSNIVVSGTTATGWVNDYNIPYSAEGGPMYVYTSGSTSNDTKYASLALCEEDHNDGTCPHYHVGNYYNWSAAIASNDSSSITAQYTIADNDICPAGWRLPKGLSSATSSATTREFGELFRASGVTSSLTATSYVPGGFNTLRATPLFFVRGGYVYGGSLYNLASYGGYWSSTVYSSSYAYTALFGSSFVYSAGSYGRTYGFPIRCLVE